MECNKEEAIRAKELAEKKMQDKDFFGAKKFALKAKQLFADLENISQIISVCQVHCCASSKINGEMDWYGILQVEQTADDSSIKKQYRKLALQLHPDKNKFPGAEAAFKLIGEANITLADRSKRSVYDMKRRSTIPKVVSRPQPQSNVATTRPVGQNTSSFGKVTPPPSNAQNQAQTFWTKCPTCCAKFQYYCTLLNANLRCHRCLTNFIAFEVKLDVPIPNLNFIPQPTQSFGPRPTQSFGPRPYQNFTTQSNTNHNLKKETPVQTKTRKDTVHKAKASTAKKEKKRNKKRAVVFSESECCTDSEEEVEEMDIDDLKTRKNTVHKAKASTVKKEKKRNRKRAVVSSESECSTDSEEEVEEMDIDDLINAASSGRYPKRSSRSSQNVKYTERVNEDDNDFASPKKVKVEKKKGEENLPNGKEDSKVRSFTSPDSEFYDFEQERDPKKFEPDQIWAVYDDQDAMPRFYVRIKEVNHPFRLRFTWLEHNPQSELEQLWDDGGLPVGCGNYRLGTSVVTKDLNMFSHQISCTKGTKRNTFYVYPIKGEVWALFKGWDDSWPSNASNHSKFEYEVVEVISDCSNGPEFSVVQLVKVEGFVSLFVRSSDKPFHVPMSKILMFSHRVLAYRCSENEKEGVREGSFELDTASLPENFGCKSVNNDPSNQSTQGEKKSASPNSKTNSTCEFCNFSNGRSIEKVKNGQIWALYGDIDKYPKSYAKIKKVDHDHSMITASWVEHDSGIVEEANWTEKGLHSGRGRFKVNRKSVTFDSLELFSHIVNATSTDKDQYVISPRSGEVWAIYKDWNVNWTMEEFSKCQYIIVEIVECSFSVTVRLLTKVEGYKFVFKPEVKGGVMQEMVIPYQEGLRFSHQIPAFKLTDEVGGALQGYWELDSASVPPNL